MRGSSSTSMMKVFPIHATLMRAAENVYASPRPCLCCYLYRGNAMANGRDGLCRERKTEKPSQGQTDLQRLEGRWVRPDGGYILELGEIKKDGSLKASYFNPRPIKVFSAKWSRKEGKINLFVELRDVNYPGSKYNLQYEPRVRPAEGNLLPGGGEANL